MTEVNGIENGDNLVSDNIKKIFIKYLERIGIKNFKIDITPGSVKGDNYLGIIAKVVVTSEDLDGKEIKDNYIIKSATKSEGFRKIAPIHLAYEREMYIYKNVLPAFKEFQEKLLIKNPFNSYAEYLQSSCEDNDEALIMKDMKIQGYIMQDRKKPLDYNHIKLTLKELSKFHAVSFAMRDQNAEFFSKLISKMEGNYFTEMNASLFETYAIQQCENAMKSFKPEIDAIAIEKFNKFRPTFTYNTTDLLKEKCHPYCVIRHGDCWTNNMLYKYEDNSNPSLPTKICFLDWQLSSVGPPVLDIFYFLYATTDKKIRDNHYEEFIDYYYYSLKDFGAELGSDFEKLYPYSIYKEQLKRFGCYGLTVAIMLNQVLLSDSDEVPDINTIFDEDEDPNAALEKFSFNPRNEKLYFEKIRDTVYHTIENEYI